MNELRYRGIRAAAEVSLTVSYKGECIGEYYADILVEDVLLILKCVDQFANEHVAQCVNYLRASGLSVCLLVNFQKPKAVWRRIVHKYESS